MRLTLILLFALLWRLPAGATHHPPAIDLEPGMIDLNLEPFALMYPDHGKKLTSTAALKLLAAKAFQPYADLNIPGKFVRGQYNFWTYFSVRNPDPDTFFLAVSGSTLGRDSAFVFENEEQKEAFRIVFPAGIDRFRKVEMPLYAAFIYPVPPNTELSFLLALDHYNYRQHFLPVLTDATQFERKIVRGSRSKTTIYLILTGFLLSIIVFFGLQYLATRNPADCWYSLYALVILLVSWRNLEGANPYYIFIYRWTSWTHTKVFLTAATFISYTYFIRHFLGRETPILKKIARYVLISCLLMIVAELVLLQVDWYWSWLCYYWFRIAGSLFSLVFLVVIWRSPHPLAKFVLLGTLCLILGEVVSWFFPAKSTSEVAMVGVFLEFVFLSYALGQGNYLDRLEKVKLAQANQLLTMEKALETERLRTRIAQDIHDEVGASLTKISLTAQVAERMPRQDKELTGDHFRQIGKYARQATQQLRDIVFGINPDYDSFGEMQAYFLECAHDFWGGQPIHYQVDFPSPGVDPAVSPDVKRQLLLIYKEAMTNISRHADASEVQIRLVLKNAEHYLLEVADNGRGFDPDQVAHFSNGITGLHRRAESIRARLTIISAVGAGCLIRVEGVL